MSNKTTIYAFILSLTLLCIAQADDDVFAGSFRFVKGQVTLESKKNQTIQNASKDMQFYEGDKIATKEDSFAVLSLQDGSTIKLDTRTEIEVISLMGKKAETYLGVSRLLLKIGGVMVDVVKKFTGPPSVEIETKKKLAFGVRGTKFYTFIEYESDDTWTVVYEGTVQAFDFGHDDTEAISAGKSIVAIEGERLTLPQEYIWSKKVAWNSDPEKGKLDSEIEATTLERQNELAQVLKKILNRKRRPFINTDNNPRRMKERQIREIKDQGMMEEIGNSSTTNFPANSPSPNSIPAAANGTTSGQHAVQGNLQDILRHLPQSPNMPAPIPIEDNKSGAIAIQEACAKVAPSGFPCKIGQHACLDGEVTAAIFQGPSKIFYVCVQIFKAIYL